MFLLLASAQRKVPSLGSSPLLGQCASPLVPNHLTCFSLQLAAILMVLKGLPSTYNKDLQVKHMLAFTGSLKHTDLFYSGALC